MNIRKILHFLNSVFFAKFSHYFLQNVNIIFLQNIRIFATFSHFCIFRERKNYEKMRQFSRKMEDLCWTVYFFFAGNPTPSQWVSDFFWDKTFLKGTHGPSHLKVLMYKRETTVSKIKNNCWVLFSSLLLSQIDP